ncbi:hypothetical protein NPIL_356021 [Nephila pilipes]|uniref:Uncharacterized protein n=1 Tax=Nephila pilipes TaxID=299642 RepID=A0A8X6TZY1_NEPPI|nr:hypothetical protein NPIL_356021 [Nephila pilipes]
MQSRTDTTPIETIPNIAGERLLRDLSGEIPAAIGLERIRRDWTISPAFPIYSRPKLIVPALDPYLESACWAGLRNECYIQIDKEIACTYMGANLLG